MKRFILTAALSIGLLVGTMDTAQAGSGSAGFGFGINVNVSVSVWCNHGNNGGYPGGDHGCCRNGCFVPGFSPYYDKPCMFGGMKAAGYGFNPAPLYPGPIPYPGGYDAVGFYPVAPYWNYHGYYYPPAAGSSGAKSKAPEKNPPSDKKEIERGPAPETIEGTPPITDLNKN